MIPARFKQAIWRRGRRARLPPRERAFEGEALSIWHLRQRIESDHVPTGTAVPRVGGFRSFPTARRTIEGLEAKLRLRKGFGFAGPWTVREQNLRLALQFGLSQVS